MSLSHHMQASSVPYLQQCLDVLQLRQQGGPFEVEWCRRRRGSVRISVCMIMVCRVITSAPAAAPAAVCTLYEVV